MRDKWTIINDDEYRLLLPSLRLASNLIAAGRDYLAEFIGDRDIHDEIHERRKVQREFVVDLKNGP